MRLVSLLRWGLVLLQVMAAQTALGDQKIRVSFAGSSTIANWKTMAADFPNWWTTNLGRGGTTYFDLLKGYETWLKPALPRTERLLIYSGDNDLASRMHPQRVLQDVRNLLAEIHRDRPHLQVYLLTVKLSPSRMEYQPEILEFNALLRQESQNTHAFEIIDTESALCDSQGQPEPMNFAQDGLHLSAKGYKIWRSLVLLGVERQLLAAGPL